MPWQRNKPTAFQEPFDKLLCCFVFTVFMGSSSSALASGNPLLLYCIAGAICVQSLLLAVFCFKRSHAVLAAANYIAISVLAWLVVLSMPANFFPLQVAFVLAIFPYLSCVVVAALFKRITKKQ